MATLPTLQPGTLISASSTEATLQGTEPVLEELGSANDTTYLRQTSDNTTVTVDAWFELEDMPIGFNNMDTLAIQLRYNNSATLSLNYWGDITAQVFQSDGTTALTNEVQVVGFPSTNGNGDASIDTGNTPTNSASTTLTGLNTTAGDTIWNGARLRITYDITKQKGGDAGVTYQITAGELTGTYTAQTIWSVECGSAQSSTEVGTLSTTVSDSIELTGTESATQVTNPTVSVDDTITLNGIESATEVSNTFTIATGPDFVGVESTTEVSNTITTSVDDSIELSGQESSTELTSPAATVSDSVVLTGTESTTETGPIDGAVGIGLTGTESATEVDILISGTGAELTGLEIVHSVQTLTVQTDESVLVPGTEATSESSTLVTEIGVDLTGLESASQYGTMVPGIGAELVIVGVESSTEVGTYTLKIDDAVVLNGVESSTEVGLNFTFITSSTITLPSLEFNALQGPAVGVYVPRLSETYQSFSPSAILEFVTLDLRVEPWNDAMYYFHNGTNEYNADVVWQGQAYSAFPIYLDGFESSTQGAIPRPTLKVANISGLISTLLNQGGLPGQGGIDLVGAKITRRRTFAKYLDKENFRFGNPTADPNVYFPDDVYYINRKSSENRIFVEFELSSALDLDNVHLPRRQIIQNTCQWGYKSAECSWIPNPSTGPFFDGDDQPTNAAGDTCGKRLESCELRFGTAANLPYGAFPGAGLLSNFK